MKEAIAAALLTLLGVVITVIVAYFTSRHQARIELEKLRAGAASKLFEMRLEVYPQLYFLVSDFMKKLRRKEADKSVTASTLGAIELWESHNAILFGAKALTAYHQAREAVAMLAQLSDSAFVEAMGTDMNVKSYIRPLQSLELAMKYELGVFEVETPTRFKETPAFRSYQEALFNTVGNASNTRPIGEKPHNPSLNRTPDGAA